MNEFVKLFQSNGTVIAAIVALIGVLVAEWLNRKKFKVDMQQMANEFQQKRETDTEWGTQAFEIAAMKSSDMDEDTLLKVRNLLGPMQVYYKGGDVKGGEDGARYEIDKAQYKFLGLLNVAKQKVHTLDYYENFKNDAIKYVDTLHDVYFKDCNNFSGFSEDDSERLRMICRVLTQDRWITKEITGKTANLVNRFSIFSSINEVEEYLFSEKPGCKRVCEWLIVLGIPLLLFFVGGFILTQILNLKYLWIVVIFAYIVIAILIAIRFIIFKTALMEREEFIDRKREQQKAATLFLKNNVDDNVINTLSKKKAHTKRCSTLKKQTRRNHFFKGY